MPTKPKTHKKASSTKKHDPLPRESSTQRGYGYKWQVTRLGWLRAHPLCVECEKLDMTVMATDVDHIIPHKNDMVLFWDNKNWQSLCASCHSRKTATEDGGFGRTYKVKNETGT